MSDKTVCMTRDVCAYAVWAKEEIKILKAEGDLFEDKIKHLTAERDDLLDILTEMEEDGAL